MNTNKINELNDTELENVVGGLNVYFNNNEITIYFSSGENPSTALISIKNEITKKIGCYLDQDTSNALQNLLNQMANENKCYLKADLSRNGELITGFTIKQFF